MFVAFREGFGGGQEACLKGSFGWITTPPTGDVPGVMTAKFTGLEYECSLFRQVALYLNDRQIVTTPNIPIGTEPTDIVIIFVEDLTWAYYNSSMLEVGSYAPNG